MESRKEEVCPGKSNTSKGKVNRSAYIIRPTLSLENLLRPACTFSFAFLLLPRRPDAFHKPSASFPLHRHGCCGKLLRIVLYVHFLTLLCLCILCLFHHIVLQSVRASRSPMSLYCWRTSERLLLTYYNTLRVRHHIHTAFLVPDVLADRTTTNFFSGSPLTALTTLSFSDNVDLQRSAALAFAEITEKEVRPVGRDTLDPILFLLSSHDTEVQRAASAALGNLAVNSELPVFTYYTFIDYHAADNKLLIVKLGGLEPLIRQMLSPNVEVQCNAVGCVTNLATHGMYFILCTCVPSVTIVLCR